MNIDPAQLQASCPHCHVYTSAEVGQPTPPHQENADQKKGTCPGAGQPAV